jgi:hypothetical protein
VLRLAQAGDRRHRRAAADRDHNRLSRLEHSIADAHAPLAVQPTAAPYDRHVALCEPGQLDRIVELVDHLIAPREHGRDVEPAGHSLARTRDPPDLREQLGRPQQRLRRHAGVVGALTADQLLLDDRHPQARFAQPPGGHLAGRASADHNDIELLAHAKSLHPVGHASTPVRSQGRDTDSLPTKDPDM